MQNTRREHLKALNGHVRPLVNEDVAHNADVRDMENFIQQGLNSGTATKPAQEIFAQARQRVVEGQT